MIRLYHESDQSAVIDLVLHIQINEGHLGLALSDQPDLNHIKASYSDKGGDFWVVEDDSGTIVGCIGLMLLSGGIGVLKKFFVDSEYRGKGIASSLFSALRSRAAALGLRAIILDTPSIATRSHAFYKRAGFSVISKKDLPVPYEYPYRDSLLFMLSLDCYPAAGNSGRSGSD